MAPLTGSKERPTKWQHLPPEFKAVQAALKLYDFMRRDLMAENDPKTTETETAAISTVTEAYAFSRCEEGQKTIGVRGRSNTKTRTRSISMIEIHKVSEFIDILKEISSILNQYTRGDDERGIQMEIALCGLSTPQEIEATIVHTKEKVEIYEQQISDAHGASTRLESVTG